MLGFLYDIAIVNGPVVGYILQYRLIQSNKSVGAFSIDICLILLIANVLRINFFAFKQYQYTLVLQSALMIAAQILLLKLCVKYQTNVSKFEQSAQTHRELEVHSQRFWRWINFRQYVLAIIVFIVGSIILTVLTKLIGFNLYGDLLGLVALLTESLLSFPQIIQIYKKESGEGISYALIFLNLFGDISKTYYFYLKDQPFQFKLCGIVQISLDIIVIGQLLYHWLKPTNTSNIIKHNDQLSQKQYTSPQEQMESTINLSASTKLQDNSQKE